MGGNGINSETTVSTAIAIQARRSDGLNARSEKSCKWPPRRRPAVITTQGNWFFQGCTSVDGRLKIPDRSLGSKRIEDVGAGAKWATRYGSRCDLHAGTGFGNHSAVSETLRNDNAPSIRILPIGREYSSVIKNKRGFGSRCSPLACVRGSVPLTDESGA